MVLLLGIAFMIAVGYWLRRLQRDEDTAPDLYVKRLEERFWRNESPSSRTWVLVLLAIGGVVGALLLLGSGDEEQPRLIEENGNVPEWSKPCYIP